MTNSNDPNLNRDPRDDNAPFDPLERDAINPTPTAPIERGRGRRVPDRMGTAARHRA